jgi:single-strand DNA-binding protein
VRIAVTPRRLDRDSNSYIDGTTTFADGQVWGEQAEHLAESLHEGDRVLVIGRWG